MWEWLATVAATALVVLCCQWLIVRWWLRRSHRRFLRRLAELRRSAAGRGPVSSWPRSSDEPVAAGGTGRSRRQMLALGGGAAAAVALSAQPASAQISLGGIGDALGGIFGQVTAIRGLLGHLLGLGIPPIFRRLLDQLIRELGSAGADSLIEPSLVDGAITRSWPEAAELTATGQQIATEQQVAMTRRRVRATQMIVAEAAARQGELEAEDAAITMAAPAAGLIGLVHGAVLLLHNQNQRIGLLAIQNAALSQPSTEATMWPQHAREMRGGLQGSFLGRLVGLTS